MTDLYARAKLVVVAVVSAREVLEFELMPGCVWTGRAAIVVFSKESNPPSLVSHLPVLSHARNTPIICLSVPSTELGDLLGLRNVLAFALLKVTVAYMYTHDPRCNRLCVSTCRHSSFFHLQNCSQEIALLREKLTPFASVATQSWLKSPDGFRPTTVLSVGPKRVQPGAEAQCVSERAHSLKSSES